jgi:hypothetical protein
MKFLIKFPTRSRKELFFSTLDKYIKNFSSDNEYVIVVSCDFDDPDMNDKNIIQKLKEYKNLKLYFDHRVSKIHAINRDIDKISKEYNWDIIISAADDMIPQLYGYDKIISESMKNEFPDLNGGLWFFDGYRKDLNTMSIMGRKRYETFGYIYYPKYKTWYCDNEYTEIGLRENKLKFIDTCIIKHELHSFNSNVLFDKLYIENETDELKRHDYAVYIERKNKGFI